MLFSGRFVGRTIRVCRRGAWFGCALLLLGACDSRQGSANDSSAMAINSTGPLRVFVSILPQADFVKRIAGDRVDVEVMVGPGQSHHTYEPTPRQVSRLAEARAYFQVGLPFERAVCERIVNVAPSIHLVDTTQGITFRQMTGCCAMHDQHVGVRSSQETDTSHSHAGRDPHIWLSPRLVKTQARTIHDALVEIDPAGRVTYDAGLARFERDLDALNARIHDRLRPFAGRAFFVFHPAYGYFADEYGLEQVAVEEEGKEPSARRLVELMGRARSLGVTRVYVQPQFAVGGAKALADAIGATVVPLDPMTVDYVADLWTLAGRLAEGFAVHSTTTAASAREKGVDG